MSTTLVEAVEALTANGYLVLGPESAEDAAACLTLLALDAIPYDPEELSRFRQRAQSVLAAFPDDLILGATSSQERTS